MTVSCDVYPDGLVLLSGAESYGAVLRYVVRACFGSAIVGAVVYLDCYGCGFVQTDVERYFFVGTVAFGDVDFSRIYGECCCYVVVEYPDGAFVGRDCGVDGIAYCQAECFVAFKYGVSRDVYGDGFADISDVKS